MTYKISITINLPKIELSYQDLQHLEQECKDAVRNYLEDEEENFEILTKSKELDEQK